MGMKEFVKKLLEEMNESLDLISNVTLNELQIAERCGKQVNSNLLQLRSFMKDYRFADPKEEVLFFKYYKPQFLSELIFYAELAYIESKMPIGEQEKVKSYFLHMIDQYQDFFGRNHQLYIYHQLERSDLDELFFLRESRPLSVIPDYSMDFDPSFSTPNSNKLARIMAFEKMIELLKRRLDQMDLGFDLKLGTDTKHQWTDSKSALIELAYALHSRGAVNHGKSDVKLIIRIMESLFDVQVGNFYRTFQSMRIRKKNRTAFLDSLKDSLEKRMDETDMGY